MKIFYLNNFQTIILVYGIKRVIQHKEHFDMTLDNDIALIELQENVDYEDFIRPVCIPEMTTELTDGQPALVSGWGWLSPDANRPTVLQKALVRVL